MNKPIVIEQELDAPVEKVWKVLTTQKDMEHWFFEIDEFELKEGYTFTFYDGGEEEKYLHICKILVVVPSNKFSFSWEYEDIEGVSTVTFYLQKKDDRTLIRLVHEGTENFRTDNPNFSAESFERGWNDIINISLKEYVEYK